RWKYSSSAVLPDSAQVIEGISAGAAPPTAASPSSPAARACAGPRRSAGVGPTQPQRRHQPALGEHGQGRAFVLAEVSRARRRPAGWVGEEADDTVVTGDVSHDAGVAVDDHGATVGPTTDIGPCGVPSGRCRWPDVASGT